MNKTAIKNFAIWARVNLIEAVKQRAYEYEITKDGANNTSLESVGGRILSTAERDQRRALINEISEKGFDQVMEEAAYTWFNRFIALRFMEVNGYLPARVRVFTNEEGEFKPEIMKEAMTVEIEGLNREKVLDLMDKQNNEELFKYLIITQCNALGNGLPKMFEKIEHWTELLFPSNLLRADSVVGKMVTEIPEEDWQDAVQIIGWLYQFYNTELKDDTFEKLKKNIKISKERIPAATQIFTPDWIVRYMVENSLGRIYINEQISAMGDQSESARIEEEKAIADKMGWRYYLPEAEQDSEVRKQLNALNSERYSLTELKVIDPCMGSGHILVYAFDVLMQMYTASGWSERDAAKSIVENNLFGLDIDDRAGQLAYFAVMMKARKYNRRALAGGASGILPNVYAIQESNNISRFAVEDFCNGNAKALDEMDKLFSQMKDAKEYGSILDIKDIDFELLLSLCDSSADRITLHNNEIKEDIIPVIKIANVMAQKYDVVVTNPPYMNSSGMNSALSAFVKKHYTNSQVDLSFCFMEKCLRLLKADGIYAMINIPVWMNISSCESLRREIIDSSLLLSMLHFGRGVFGSDFGSCGFLFKNAKCKNYKSIIQRLYAKQGCVDTVEEKEVMFFERKMLYEVRMTDFAELPSSIFAYTLSEQSRKLFNGERIGSMATARQGMATADNNRFLRYWFEPLVTNTSINEVSHDTKWFPYSKGGAYRKWYGNNEYVVNWQYDGSEIRQFPKSVVRNPNFYFKEGLTWTALTAGAFSMRYLPCGYAFDSMGPVCFPFDYSQLHYAMALFNSVVGAYYLNIMCPNFKFDQKPIENVPLVKCEEKNEIIKRLTEDEIEISKNEWDSFETSWDFKRHPLI